MWLLIFILNFLVGPVWSARLDDPVLPRDYDSWVSPYAASSAPASASAGRQRIPFHVWINLGSFKTAPTSTSLLPEHLKHVHELSQRETNYTVHLVDDTAQHAFMRTRFANTSALWAFEAINPRIGVSKSDIWRYAQLLLYGGV